MGPAFSVRGAVPVAEKQQLDELRVIPFKSRSAWTLKEPKKMCVLPHTLVRFRAQGKSMGAFGLERCGVRPLKEPHHIIAVLEEFAFVP